MYDGEQTYKLENGVLTILNQLYSIDKDFLEHEREDIYEIVFECDDVDFSIFKMDKLKSVKKIDFSKCSKLNKIPKKLLENYICLEEVIFPNNEELVIEEDAFSYCSKLSNVILPKRLKKVCMHAFSYSSLPKISINSGIIEDYAFSGSRDIFEVELGENVKVLGIGNFKYVNKITINNPYLRYDCIRDNCVHILGDAREVYIMDANNPNLMPKRNGDK